MSNFHCTVVSINGNGILIEGPSGSGKSSLALGLLERAEAKSISSSLVCDDQALLEARDGRLIAKAPSTIAGKIEVRGFGIVDLPFIKSVEVNLVARLVSELDLERMPKPKTETKLEITIPRIDVPAKHEEQAKRIIFAWLDQFA